MSSSIRNASFLGQHAWVLEAGGYRLTVLEYGANPVELKHGEHNVSILRTPSDWQEYESKSVCYGVPVLLPPNRLEKATFSAAGRLYRFPVNTPDGHHLHGILHRKRWNLDHALQHEDGSVSLSLKLDMDRHEEMFAYFPHPFHCRITFLLSAAGLEQTVEVTNLGEEVMPFGFGFHTALRFPYHPDSGADDYLLRLSVGSRWEMSKNMPTGGVLAPDEIDAALTAEGVSPSAAPLSRHYQASPMEAFGRPFHGAIISDVKRSLHTVYEVDPAFGHWMLWNDKGDKGYICPEPQTMMVNAPNVELPQETTGFLYVQSGATWTAKQRLYVSDEKV